MELPKKKVKPDRRNPKILVIYSPPKLGKTTLLAQLEDNLILDLEDGTKYLEALKIKVNNISELGDSCKSIIEANKPYKFVTVDTITKLEEWCEGQATKTYKATPMGKNFKGKSVLELPNGGGYLWLRQAFQQWLDAFYLLSDHLILVGHIKDKFIEVQGKEVSAKDLDLTGKIKSITCANADAICYLYRDSENKIIANFKSSEDVICGSRCDHLRGQTFEFDWNKIYID